MTLSAAHSPALPLAEVTSDARRALLVLTLIYGISQVDRQVISLLLPGIKGEFELSDTQLGLLTGMAFALLYTVSALVLSRWSDKGNRRAVIAAGLAFYSLMTLLSFTVRSVLQLTLLRFGVAIGEGSGLAPSTALISDYFPPERRAQALALFVSGSFLGTILIFPIVGWSASNWGWRTGFLFAGVPGLLLAAILWFAVKDPPVKRSTAAVPPLGETLRFILGQRSVLWLYAGTVGHSTALFGFSLWVPTFLSRVHDMSLSSIGTSVGLVSGMGGMAGAAAGGWVADRLGRARPVLGLAGPALASMLALPAALVFLMAGDIRLVLAAFGFMMFFLVSAQGAIWATLHGSVRVRMRALAGAISGMLVNLLALGLGPLIVGMIADHLAPDHGAQAIRFALIAPAGIAFLGSVCLVIAALANGTDRARAAEGEA